MINILSKELDFETANWYDKKILYQIDITKRSITVLQQKQVYVIVSMDMYI